MWSFAIILILSLFHCTTCSSTENNGDEKGTTADIEIIDGPNLNTSGMKGTIFHVSQYLKMKVISSTNCFLLINLYNFIKLIEFRVVWYQQRHGKIPNQQVLNKLSTMITYAT